MSSRNRAKNTSPFSLTTFIISHKTVVSLNLYLRRRVPRSELRTRLPYSLPLRSRLASRVVYNFISIKLRLRSLPLTGLKIFAAGYHSTGRIFYWIKLKAERMRANFCVKCVLSCRAISSHLLNHRLKRIAQPFSLRRQSVCRGGRFGCATKVADRNIKIDEVSFCHQILKASINSLSLYYRSWRSGGCN